MTQLRGWKPAGGWDASTLAAVQRPAVPVNCVSKPCPVQPGIGAAAAQEHPKGCAGLACFNHQVDLLAVDDVQNAVCEWVQARREISMEKCSLDDVRVCCPMHRHSRVCVKGVLLARRAEPALRLERLRGLVEQVKQEDDSIVVHVIHDKGKESALAQGGRGG